MSFENLNREEFQKGLRPSQPCKHGLSCRRQISGECKLSHEGDDLQIRRMLAAGLIEAYNKISAPPKSVVHEKKAIGERRKGERPMCHKNMSCGNTECKFKHDTPNKKSPSTQIDVSTPVPQVLPTFSQNWPPHSYLPNQWQYHQPPMPTYVLLA